MRRGALNGWLFIQFHVFTCSSRNFQAALAAEKDVQPVGEDYVEEERNASGKLVNYNCKLCDCKFSDPNAKNIHIKGRKHRLQYKVCFIVSATVFHLCFMYRQFLSNHFPLLFVILWAYIFS